MVTAAAKLLAILDSLDAPFAERLAAGEALAALGDSRATAIDRVAIPAGVLGAALTSGTPPGKPAAPPPCDGTPPSQSSQAGSRAEEVHVAAFLIDRYPVTVAAYAEFITEGGYEDASLWTPEGWAWREDEGIEAPRFWDEEEWAAYLVPNHPVVGVSVHEAEAYAAFRGARLPTEAEWERACRGPAGGCYPWGDVWQEDASGQRGVGPRGTVPIGVFPRGASPYGIRDLVGCVWQWCADSVARGERSEGDSEGDDEPLRITRGGGWNNLAWSIGCMCRNAYPPSARFSNLGFRCAV